MTVHISIMTKEILNFLGESLSQIDLSKEAWIVDCTLGGGGHTSSMIEAFSSKFPKLKFLSVDRDVDAVSRARVRFEKEIASGILEIQHSTFGDVAERLDRNVVGVLADLGLSSDQLDSQDRGFSFLTDAPLDMRMDSSQGETAANLLTQMDEQEIETILRDYGDERFARSIARKIVAAIKEGNAPQTTKDLVGIVVRAVPPKARHGKIHVATRTFQALRILVNRELDQLKALLEHGIISLSSGGRICVMSFHSGEDRMVKRAFRDCDRERFRIITKRPVVPTEEEIRSNSRASSAKLRVLERK